MVVVSDYIDTNGYPVIIAVHFDKKGVVEKVNDVASMYGKREYSEWVEKQRKKGNVLYESKTKGPDAVPRIGLQLSSMVSESDPFVINSIPTSTQKVNNTEMKVRGYNESIVEKTDLPEEVKNEFITNPQMC